MRGGNGQIDYNRRPIAETAMYRKQLLRGFTDAGVTTMVRLGGYGPRYER